MLEQLKKYIQQAETLEALDDIEDGLSEDFAEKLTDELEARRSELEDSPTLSEATDAEIVAVVDEREELQAKLVDAYADLDNKTGEANNETNESPTGEAVDYLWDALSSTDLSVSDNEPVDWDEQEGDLLTDEHESISSLLTVVEAETELEDGSTETEQTLQLSRPAVQSAIDQLSDEDNEITASTEAATQYLISALEDSIQPPQVEEEEEEEAVELPEPYQDMKVVDKPYNPEGAKERLLDYANEHGPKSVRDAFALFEFSFADGKANTTMVAPIADVEDGELVLNRRAVKAAKSGMDIDDEEQKEHAVALVDSLQEALGVTPEDHPVELVSAAQRLGIEDAADLSHEALLASIDEATATLQDHVDEDSEDADNSVSFARYIMR